MSVLEFGFAAPIALGMILGSVELGYLMFARSQLESAVTAAAREAISGAVTVEIDPTTGKPYTRDKLIQKRVQEAMAQVSLIKISIHPSDPTKGNPRTFVTPYSSIASGGSGFSKIRQPEPIVDANGNNQCDLNPVLDGTGNTVREKFSDSNGNTKWDNGGNFGGAGAPGDIVVYDVEVDSPLLFGGFVPLGTKDAAGKMQNFKTLKSQVVVQNEIWSVASTNARIQRYCNGAAV
jgi:hypothetical protein